jgi:hypothetical protein
MRGAGSDRARAAIVLGAVHARGEADARAHADAAPSRRSRAGSWASRHGDAARHARAPADTRPWCPARGAVGGASGHRSALPERARAGVDAQAGRRWRARRASDRRRPDARDPRARRDRRHDRASHPPHRVALERRRRREPGRHPACLEPRSGVNDPPHGSERAVWIAGSPTEVAPVSFAADLSSIRCEQDGAELRFLAEAQRSRHDELLIVGSDYRAPFGTFSGTLPGGEPLAHGLGVVEHHRARW